MIFVFFIIIQFVLSAPNEWSFLSGTGELFSTGDQDTGIPRGRAAHSGWLTGNTIYIFGGFSNNVADRMDIFCLNDWWEYQITGNTFTHLGGCDMQQTSGNQQGVYSGTVFPGARYGALSFKNGESHLLYGGKGYGESDTQIVLGDLWEFNIGEEGERSDWSCIICDGTDGINAVFDETVVLGAKYMSTVFQRNDDIAYIFGGSGYGEVGSPDYGFMNDMWKVEGKVFSYINGGKQPFDAGSFTTSMYGAKGWVLGSKLYLFGGRGLKSGADTPPAQEDLTYFNNLFSFDVSSKRWSFISGSGEDNEDNPLGVGENPIQLDLGEKPIFASDNVTTYCDGNYPGSRAFHFTFAHGNYLYMFGGIGLETFPDDTTNGKPYSGMWIYNIAAKQWKIDGNWRLPDGEGGIYTTKDSFDGENWVGAKHLGLAFKKDRRVFTFFGWGADSRNIKYGAYYDTLMATTDEVWEFYTPGAGSGGGIDSTAAAVVAVILSILCCVVFFAVIIIIIVVVVIKKRKSSGGSYNNKSDSSSSSSDSDKEMDEKY